MPSLSGKSNVICVAGGSGAVGHHVCEELLIANEGFKVVLLLRKENKKLIESLHSTTSTNGKNENLFHEIVDFNDSKSLEACFNRYECDTVISALNNPDNSHTAVEHVILEAILVSGSVRRFIPALFGFPPERMTWDVYDSKKAMQQKLRKLQEHKSISWTYIINGAFMNYLACNAPPRSDKHLPGAKEVRPGTGFLVPYSLGFDINSRTAAIAGTGNEPIVFTTVQDTARFVSAACTLETEWNEEIGYVAGDLTTFNKVKDIIESTIGAKLEVTYKPLADLEKQEKEPVDPSNPLSWFLLQADLVFARTDCSWDNALANQIKFKPTSVEQFIKEWWS